MNDSIEVNKPVLIGRRRREHGIATYSSVSCADVCQTDRSTTTRSEPLDGEARRISEPMPQLSIATETQKKEDPRWKSRIDELLRLYSLDKSSGIEPPTREALQKAGEYLLELRKKLPVFPPEQIIPEPEGGVEVRYWLPATIHQRFSVVATFLNERKTEVMVIVNEKVVHDAERYWPED